MTLEWADLPPKGRHGSQWAELKTQPGRWAKYWGDDNRSVHPAVQKKPGYQARVVKGVGYVRWIGENREFDDGQ